MRRYLGVLALVVVLAACEYPYMVQNVDEGQVVSTSTLLISGDLGPLTLSPDGVLTVQGQTVPVNPDRTWSATVTVNTSQLINVIDISYFDGYTTFTEHRAIVSGPSLTDGQASPDGVGLHFTNTGLASLGPVIEDLAGGNFDVSSLLVPATQTTANAVINQDVEIVLGITANVKGWINEAEMGKLNMTTAATASGMQTTLTINDFYIGLDLTISGFGACKLELNIPTTTVKGTYDMSPGNPGVDVTQVGGIQVTTSGVNYEFISGVCDPDSFLIGGLVSGIAGAQIGSAIDGAFNSQLGDPDGAGPADSVISDAIETALGGLDIDGQVGAALGLNLDAPLQSITENASGVTLRSNADFFSTIGSGPNDCAAVAGAPSIGTTYNNPSSFPTFGTTTPSGQSYGIGMAISSSAFNQMLESMAECGQFNSTLTSIDLGGGAVPITAGLLTAIEPRFNQFPASTPFTLSIKPTGAPFITDAAGPNGEMATLMIPSIQIGFNGPVPNQGIQEVLRVNIDAPLGLNLAFDPVANALVPTITAGPPGSVTARVTSNGIGANSLVVATLFQGVFPMFVSSLTSSFAAFPMPTFLGLQLSVVQTVRSGNNFILYSNIAATPQTRIANVSLSNTSDANYEEDDSVTDSSQWRQSTRKIESSTAVSTHMRAAVGADACCFSDDQSIDKTGRYSVNFDVVPEGGDTWHLNLVNSFSGAHTHVDDGGSSARTEFRNPSGFSSQIVGRYRLNSGAWTDFSFNVSPSGVTSSGGTNQGVSGSSSRFISGTAQTHVDVEYQIRLYALSDSCFSVFGCGAVAGDEGSIRAGLNDTLANGYTAGEYPGPGGRLAKNDGQFGTITLTTN